MVNRVYDKKTNSYVNDVGVESWSMWKQRYAEQLHHIVGFEEKFVDLVLSKIDVISPRDVIPQYHFKDSKNGSRYVDFMILNKEKNYCLPIELDGYSKMVGNGREYHKFNDFLERQNAMVKNFGLVLRYTNKKMLNESHLVIQEITHTLKKQSDKVSTDEIGKTHIDRLYQDMIDRFESYIGGMTVISNEELSTLKAQLDKLAKQVDGGVKTPPSPVKDRIPQKPKTPARNQQIATNNSKNKVKTKQFLGIGVAGLLLLGAGAVLFSGDEASDSSGYSTEYGSDLNEEQVYDIKPIESFDAKKVDLVHTQIENLQDHEHGKVPSEDKIPLKATSSETISSVDLNHNAASSISIPVAKESVQAQPESSSISSANNSTERLDSNYETTVSSSIPAAKAYQYIGSQAVVCGYVAQVKKFSKGTYLNLGATYPNQDATILVWDSDLSNLGSVDGFQGSELCVSGTVDSYKGVPQIKLTTRSQLQ